MFRDRLASFQLSTGILYLACYPIVFAHTRIWSNDCALIVSIYNQPNNFFGLSLDKTDHVIPNRTMIIKAIDHTFDVNEPKASDLQAFWVFSQHPKWFITPVNPSKACSIAFIKLLRVYRHNQPSVFNQSERAYYLSYFITDDIRYPPSVIRRLILFHGIKAKKRVSVQAKLLIGHGKQENTIHLHLSEWLLIIGELKHPRRRCRQEWQKFAYLSTKNNSFVRLAWAILVCTFQGHSRAIWRQMTCFALVWTTWVLDNKV